TGAEAGILTNRVHTKAKIANISPRQIHYLLNEDYIVVVAGFQGQSNEGETTTLGRGGSDLTAIALAGALNADACQIFTDVDDVRDEPGVAARIFSTISEANIVVDMIVQSVSEHGTTDLSFTIHENDLDLARKILTPIVAELKAAQLIAKSGVAKLSVVGIG